MLLLGACGRLGFDSIGGVGGVHGDAASDDGMMTGGDGGTLGDAADLGSFGAPMQHPMLASARFNKHPSLTADLLEIYFESGRICGNCMDVHVATRASVTAAWSTPVEVPALVNAAYDMAPEIAPDGLTLWYASERESPAGGSDIWVTTRANRTQPWAPPVRETTLSTAGYDLGPSLGDDGLTMLLTSDGAGGAAADIYVATRATTTSAWSTPVPLAELNTSVHEATGSLRDGGRELYFDRETSAGQYDIYVVRRVSTTDAFGPASLVTTVNSPQSDVDVWVSADRRTLFFASARGGDMQIYEARR